MKKQDIKEALGSYTGGAAVITRAQFARFMGIKNPKNVDKYLCGLDRISGKYYLITDVTNVLYSTSQRYADRKGGHFTNDYVK